jgi:hypothetical protein
VVRRQPIALSLLTLAGLAVVACSPHEHEPGFLGTPPALGAMSPGDWTVEAGTRVPEGSAPATLRLRDGSFRMYLPGLALRTSADGLAWAPPQRIALAEAGESLRNPAVAVAANGSFVMLYEGVKDESLSSRVTRIYRAVSDDGITFKKTPGSGLNGAVLEPREGDLDFLSAPDVVPLADGSLRLYFNTADGARVETARSTDDGATWVREGAVTIGGFAANRKAADPDVVGLPGDGFRLFFAAGVPGQPNPRILSATSQDGRSFTLDDGERLAAPDAGTHRVDPDVVALADGSYRMYFAEAADAAGPYAIRSATFSAR